MEQHVEYIVNNLVRTGHRAIFINAKESDKIAAAIPDASIQCISTATAKDMQRIQNDYWNNKITIMYHYPVPWDGEVRDSSLYRMYDDWRNAAIIVSIVDDVIKVDPPWNNCSFPKKPSDGRIFPG